MSSARQHFRQNDLVKALKAMTRAGVRGRVEITADKIAVIVGDTTVAIVPEQDDHNINEWDAVK
jgi:hypothetical protein